MSFRQFRLRPHEDVCMSNKSEPPKVGYSIREACIASSLGRTTIYAHIASGLSALDPDCSREEWIRVNRS